MRGRGEAGNEKRALCVHAYIGNESRKSWRRFRKVCARRRLAPAFMNRSVGMARAKRLRARRAKRATCVCVERD